MIRGLLPNGLCWPYLIDIGGSEGKAYRFTLRVPSSDPQKTQHVHLIDLFHSPARFEQRVVGRIDIFR